MFLLSQANNSSGLLRQLCFRDGQIQLSVGQKFTDLSQLLLNTDTLYFVGHNKQHANTAILNLHFIQTQLTLGV